jgi:hypothetical protein
MGGHPLFKKLTEEELALHESKNTDYAKGGDPLGNFKRVGSILSLYPGLDLSKPICVALVYMLKQLDAALWMLSQGYEGKVENIDSRLQDVHVYAKIARVIHAEDRVDHSQLLTDAERDVAMVVGHATPVKPRILSPIAYYKDREQVSSVESDSPEKFPF